MLHDSYAMHKNKIIRVTIFNHGANFKEHLSP